MTPLPLVLRGKKSNAYGVQDGEEGEPGGAEGGAGESANNARCAVRALTGVGGEKPTDPSTCI